MIFMYLLGRQIYKSYLWLTGMLPQYIRKIEKKTFKKGNDLLKK